MNAAKFQPTQAGETFTGKFLGAGKLGTDTVYGFDCPDGQRRILTGTIAGQYARLFIKGRTYRVTYEGLVGRARNWKIVLLAPDGQPEAELERVPLLDSIEFK